MTPSPAVSVIICVRNGETSITRQLDALSRQVQAPPFEVIVVDNGSTDSTKRRVIEWADRNLGKIGQLTVIDAGRRPSIPHARNQGALAARGVLLAYCDADDEVGPGWLHAHATSTCDGLRGGRLLPVRRTGEPAPEAFVDGLQPTSYLPMVPGSNYSISRELLLDLGGFDESLPPYGCEDLELSWRVQEAGHPVVYLATAEVHFTLTPPSRAVRKEYRVAKARMAVAARHPLSTPQPTPATILTDLVRLTLLLPARLVVPRDVKRTRHVRWAVDAVGRAVGYWTYHVLRRPAQLLHMKAPHD